MAADLGGDQLGGDRRQGEAKVSVTKGVENVLAAWRSANDGQGVGR